MKLVASRRWLFVTLISALCAGGLWSTQLLYAPEARARFGDDAEQSRGQAIGPIAQMTLQMAPGSDTCLRGKALFIVDGVGFAIGLESSADERLYNLVLSAHEFGRHVAVEYASDESRKEWVAACDAFQSDRKYFKVRALSVQSTEFVPSRRRRARNRK